MVRINKAYRIKWKYNVENFFWLNIYVKVVINITRYVEYLIR